MELEEKEFVERMIKRQNSFMLYLAAIGLREIGYDTVRNILRIAYSKKKVGYQNYRSMQRQLKNVHAFLKDISRLVVKPKNSETIVSDEVLKRIWYEASLYKVVERFSVDKSYFNKKQYKIRDLSVNGTKDGISVTIPESQEESV